MLRLVPDDRKHWRCEAAGDTWCPELAVVQTESGEAYCLDHVPEPVDEWPVPKTTPGEALWAIYLAVNGQEMDSSTADVVVDALATAGLKVGPPGEPCAFPAVLDVGGIAVCPRCGSTEFHFDESVQAPRSMADNEKGALTFWGHSDSESDGDDNPGVRCGAMDGTGGCGIIVDLPTSIRLDWK